jgi:hypothetical protein
MTELNTTRAAIGTQRRHRAHDLPSAPFVKRPALDCKAKRGEHRPAGEGMYCCIECFADDRLREVVRENSEQTANCTYCGREDVDVLHVRKLLRLVQDIFGDVAQLHRHGLRWVERGRATTSRRFGVSQIRPPELGLAHPLQGDRRPLAITSSIAQCPRLCRNSRYLSDP